MYGPLCLVVVCVAVALFTGVLGTKRSFRIDPYTPVLNTENPVVSTQLTLLALSFPY